jgi:hypothetical protein
MSKLTEETYEKIIDFLLEKVDTLTAQLVKAEKLAKDRLEDAIGRFDKNLNRPPFPKKKDGRQWSINKKKVDEPRWFWYN